MSTEAMKLALEALDFFAHMRSVSEDTMRLISDLRERLAQPVQFKCTVVDDEREACAKVCESTPWTTDIEWWKQATKKEVGEKSAYECAAAIRARGETK